MSREEALKLIRHMTDRDLPNFQFKDEVGAQDAAAAYSIVLEKPYVAVRRGYKWMVEPASGAVQLTVRRGYGPGRHQDRSKR
jgi:hypothetical protein